MEDRRIIELCFLRDEQAIQAISEKYGKLCYSIAFSVLHNREDAEECFNDTLNAVWNSVPPQRPDNLSAYVCRIARNQALKRLEYQMSEKRRADLTVSLEELAEILPDDRYAPDVRDEDVGKLISTFLRGQKEIVRNVFLRRYYYCDSVADIAMRYSFTESKVKNMLFRTRNKLRKYLIKEGVEV